MSTRSAIARCNKTFAKTGGFKGVYHHWDGYPSGLGKELFDAYKGTTGTAELDKFKGDLEGLLAYLIDEHPAGWSTIQAHECFYPEEHTKKRERGEPKNYGDRSVCNCTLWPEPYTDKPWSVTQKNASDSGCEWVYAFDVKNKKMYVLSSVNEDGSKMIGMFGCGNPDAEWKPVACVDLDGEEPDWERVQYGAALDVYNYYRTREDCTVHQKGEDDDAAYCPSGHEFYKGWRQPGDVCEGRSVNARGETSGLGPFHPEGCGHKFELPALDSANVPTISGGAAALNK